MPVFDTALFVLAATATIAGIARGMSGFGTGMIVAPIAGALYGPKAALVIIVLIDTLPMVPVAIPAMKLARWREVLPVLLGLFMFFPLGLFILKTGNPLVLRWIICAMILICVAALWSGWRYRGKRTVALSLATGAASGTLSGIASLPGPPVIIYWLAANMPAAIMRANLIVLFFLGEFVSVGNLWIAGMFEKSVVLLGVIAAPFYFAGLLCGSKLFGLASERTYRAVTFVLIVAAAILALPALDGVFAALSAMTG